MVLSLIKLFGGETMVAARTFNGKRYRFAGEYSSRLEADSRAGAIRRKGQLARVIQGEWSDNIRRGGNVNHRVYRLYVLD